MRGTAIIMNSSAFGKTVKYKDGSSTPSTTTISIVSRRLRRTILYLLLTEIDAWFRSLKIFFHVRSTKQGEGARWQVSVTWECGKTSPGRRLELGVN